MEHFPEVLTLLIFAIVVAQNAFASKAYIFGTIACADWLVVVAAVFDAGLLLLQGGLGGPFGRGAIHKGQNSHWNKNAFNELVFVTKENGEISSTLTSRSLFERKGIFRWRHNCASTHPKQQNICATIKTKNLLVYAMTSARYAGSSWPLSIR